ncbi:MULTISPECIES: nuclear transport factor 2 family protein [unclassified Chelatococcus]|uniref:nuclear transport factor 2 family protein n=1 Tax=unclassified Chelatococcus TaxID=2638111 RepID=UPI0020C13CA4|nr:MULTISPECIES: nuclear transport factor 2 family protein [unclassified Chelatococcus]
MISYGIMTALAATGLALAAFTPVALANSAGKENKAIVQRAFDAWAAGTGSPYDLLADNVTWTIAGNSLASKTYPSREAFLNGVIRPFVARMSVGLKPAIKDIYTDGDTVIIHFDAAGTAKDGKPYVNTYAWFLDMDGGKIVKATAFYDSIAFNDLWTRVEP